MHSLRLTGSGKLAFEGLFVQGRYQRKEGLLILVFTTANVGEILADTTPISNKSLYSLAKANKQTISAVSNV